MPTSDPRVISTIVHRAIGLAPASVLDLGIGYGKYGVLLREYLGQNLDRSLRLIGVEGFPGYESARWSVYDAIRREDFSDDSKWADYSGFDLVLMVDSLEHLDMVRGRLLLRELIAHNKTILVSVPNGVSPQGAYKGNNLECHRATWTREDLLGCGGRILLEEPYGLLAEFTR